MKKFINHQLSAIIVLIVAIFTLFLVLIEKRATTDLLTAEVLFNSILGIIGGILLLKNAKYGLMISLIWAILQIPYYVKGDINGYSFVFNFFQTLHFDYGYRFFIPIGKIQPFEAYGINLVAVLYLLILLFTKTSTSKSSNRK